MEMIYYTIAAVILYFLSDSILNRIEIRMGKRLANRSFIFLIIITILAIVSFNLIRAIFVPLGSAQLSTDTQIEQTSKDQPLKNSTQVIQTTKDTKK